MRKMAFQQGAGALLNSAQESFCNALKMPAQLLAWALAPRLQLSPDRRLTHSPHGGGGRGGEEVGGGDAGRAWAQRPRILPAQAAWDSASVVCGGVRQCPLLSGDLMLFLPRYFPETSSPTAHNLLIPPSSNRNYSLTPLLY